MLNSNSKSLKKMFKMHSEFKVQLEVNCVFASAPCLSLWSLPTMSMCVRQIY